MHNVLSFSCLKYLQMVHDVADCLTLPLQVVYRGAAERHGAVLRGAVSNLSVTQTACCERRGGCGAGGCRVRGTLYLSVYRRFSVGSSVRYVVPLWQLAHLEWATWCCGTQYVCCVQPTGLLGPTVFSSVPVLVFLYFHSVDSALSKKLLSWVSAFYPTVLKAAFKMIWAKRKVRRDSHTSRDSALRICLGFLFLCWGRDLIKYTLIDNKSHYSWLDSCEEKAGQIELQTN